MGKVLFRQYVWLINLLKRNKKLTFKEINSYWVNSIYNHEGKKLIPRTFKNWRDTILEEFQVDIVTVNNRYYQINNPEALERDSSLRWMMESISIHETIADSKDMKDRVLLESVPSSHNGLLTIVMNAMKEGKLLSMNYKRFNDDTYNPAKTVAPMCVKMHQRRWYMLAKVVGEEPKVDDPSPFKKFGVMRVFALDRIKALYELDETFEFPEGFKPEDYFADFFGIYSNFDRPVERVLLAVPEYQRGWIETLPLHHSQRKVEQHDDYSVFEYKMRIMPDFCRAILYNGLDIQVLEPQSLLQEMAAITEELDRMYNPECFE